MSIRDLEEQSIRAYLTAAAKRGAFVGRVLDFGAGKQPYRAIVEDNGGAYTPFDRMIHPASVATTDVGPDEALWLPENWDAILCTQVTQYIPSYLDSSTGPPYPVDGVLELLIDMHEALVQGGRLVMTGPTNWPVVETQDLQRFTVEGIVSLVGSAGFPSLDCHYRAHVMFEGERWPLGWGCVATKGE